MAGYAQYLENKYNSVLLEIGSAACFVQVNLHSANEFALCLPRSGIYSTEYKSIHWNQITLNKTMSNCSGVALRNRIQHKLPTL